MIYTNLIKTYGPYKNGEGRLVIWLKFGDGTKRGVSYPKYLMELYLNRYLEDNETVDHIDGNFLNNEISNLRVLDRKEHVKLDVIRNKDIEINCTYCNKLFTISGSKLHSRNRKDRNNSGYFCSRSCSGKYGVEIQRGKRVHKVINKVVPEKIKFKNLSII